MAGKQDQDDTDSPIKYPNDPTENSLRSIHMPESSKNDIDDTVEKDMQRMKLHDDNHDSIGTNDATNNHSTGGTAESIGGLTLPHDHHKTPYKSTMVHQAQQKKLDENKNENRDSQRQATGGGNPPYFDNEIPCDKKILKITHINPDVFIRACNLLNIHRIHGNDWRSLAGRLGYNVTDVKIFEESKDKGGSCGAMLCDWSTEEHHYIEEVVKECKEMGRADLVNLLQPEIEKKGEKCNCPDCGHIC